MRFLIVLVLGLLASSSLAADRGPSHPFLPLWTFNVGAAVGFAELAAFHNVPTGTLIQHLDELRKTTNAVTCTTMPGRIESLIAQTRAAGASNLVYGEIVKYRNDLMVHMEKNCTCNCDETQRKMLYQISDYRYGIGTACLTYQEAYARKAAGENISPLNQTCDE